jgi:cytochrome c-type biogenesis protein
MASNMGLTLPGGHRQAADRAGVPSWGQDMDGNDLILHSPVGFVVAFGGGIISFLSPCVLPLVPSYLSMMSGVGTSELARPSGPDQRRLLRSSLLFVAGFTSVFAALEATASGLGRALQSHQHLLNQLAGVVIIVAGLLLAGFITPGWLMGERRWHPRPSRLGVWAPPLMGMAFAFGWTPCIGPILAAVLSLASDTHTLGRGEAMLVAYSLGLGVPFVIAGVAFGRLAGLFSFFRRHARTINLVSGLLLAALGVLLLTDNLHLLSTWFSDLLRALGLGRLSTV